MEAQVNVNGMKEAVAILSHVQKVVNEHKKMQKAVEEYLEKCGQKRQYEQFAGKRMGTVKQAEMKKNKGTLKRSLEQQRKQKQKFVR